MVSLSETTIKPCLTLTEGHEIFCGKNIDWPEKHSQACRLGKLASVCQESRRLQRNRRGPKSEAWRRPWLIRSASRVAGGPAIETYRYASGTGGGPRERHRHQNLLRQSYPGIVQSDSTAATPLFAKIPPTSWKSGNNSVFGSLIRNGGILRACFPSEKPPHGVSCSHEPILDFAGPSQGGVALSRVVGRDDGR